MSLPVSIIIPVHNGEEHLGQSIASAIAQDVAEIIVIDDASTDKSVEIANRYSDKITLVKRLERKGQAYRLNEGVRLSTWPFIQFLDADDYLLKDKVSEQLKHLQNSEALVNYSNFSVIKFTNRIPSTVYEVNTGAYGLLEALLRYEKMPTPPCFLFKREVFNTILWDESERYKPGLIDRKLALDLISKKIPVAHFSFTGYVHRCGWSGEQISSDSNYLEQEEVFYEDVFNLVDDIKTITYRRYDKRVKDKELLTKC